MEYPSQTIAIAVQQISKLPGIGKKTALRLALHLLKQDIVYTNELTESLLNLKTKTQFCKNCYNISDSDICSICTSARRDKSLLCVVEDTKDVIAIENTAQYSGLYFVLGGIISPLNGIGPNELRINELMKKFEHNSINEVIFALSPTIDGDTTAFYIAKKLKNSSVKMSTIARGIPIGNDLEYTDEITLGRSIIQRINFSGT